MVLLERTCPTDDLRRDVLQLGGLAKFSESDGFPPLRGNELTDLNMPRRMIDYCDLVEEVVAELKTRGVARTEGLLPTHTWFDTGRYFRVVDEYDYWIGVALVPWRNAGITPLWLSVTPHIGNHYGGLEKFFEDVYEVSNQRKSRKRDAKYIPIRLGTGLDRDGVIKDSADQVQRIVEKFEEIIGTKREAGEDA